jgi:hypothetical protein
MISSYLIHTSLDIGLSRLGSAIIFGRLLSEYKDTDKGVGDLADTLLMITDIDGITQMVRDYKQHILNK